MKAGQLYLQSQCAFLRERNGVKNDLRIAGVNQTHLSKNKVCGPFAKKERKDPWMCGQLSLALRILISPLNQGDDAFFLCYREQIIYRLYMEMGLIKHSTPKQMSRQKPRAPHFLS